MWCWPTIICTRLRLVSVCSFYFERCVKLTPQQYKMTVYWQGLHVFKHCLVVFWKLAQLILTV